MYQSYNLFGNIRCFVFNQRTQIMCERFQGTVQGLLTNKVTDGAAILQLPLQHPEFHLQKLSSLCLRQRQRKLL